jgi:hypothetical protein
MPVFDMPVGRLPRDGRRGRQHVKKVVQARLNLTIFSIGSKNSARLPAGAR